MESSVTITANIKEKKHDNLKIEVSIPLVSSMLYGEEIIQQAVNAVGSLATKELLKSLDTDGSPIEFGNIKMTSKGEILKEYETPYGKVDLKRYVYQCDKGGNTFIPLEKEARIIGSATPKLAKTISNKYSNSSADEVKDDLKNNHSRDISRGYIQNISDAIGKIAINKSESWHYVPKFKTDEIDIISIGIDGAMMLMKDDGYREAMSGTIAFYNKNGDRIHTDYIAASPEYGKATFFKRMENEIIKIKKNYPNVKYIGIADGASSNWTFLKKHTNIQITDFFHAAEYLTKASLAIFNNEMEKKRVQWLDKACHTLKHEAESTDYHIIELERFLNKNKLSASKQDKLNTVITYFKNQKSRMNYSEYREKNFPIGSGVTEAACKTIIKQRLCRSGMRWRNSGAAIVLELKCLTKSKRWETFWSKINQYGVPIAA